jgi:hypothetical protein
MARLEEFTKDTTVKGTLPGRTVTIAHGDDVVEAIHKGPDGKPRTELLFRHREATLEIVEAAVALGVYGRQPTEAPFRRRPQKGRPHREQRLPHAEVQEPKR